MPQQSEIASVLLPGLQEWLNLCPGLFGVQTQMMLQGGIHNGQRKKTHGKLLLLDQIIAPKGVQGPGLETKSFGITHAVFRLNAHGVQALGLGRPVQHQIMLPSVGYGACQGLQGLMLLRC
ncbi:MAG: hypothetical protein EBS08_01395 [Cytophagia bacterium]|nr:hypothetical protein [Cytophagia bacterium]